LSPLRIIIIAILVYLAFRLITGGRKSKTTDSRQKETPREMPASDILEEDPVCKKLVPRQQAVAFEYRGKKHYFCSKECCDTFRTKRGEK
jgi:YHS domain-containing protein